MKAKEIIKEIDPNYEKCFYCNRYIHISELMDMARPWYAKPGVKCMDRTDCSNFRWNEGKYKNES